MKLSVETQEVSKKFGDIKAFELIKEAGFDAIDYSYCGFGDDSPALGDNYIEYAKKLREHLDKIGLICNQAHAPYRLRFGESIDLSEPHYLEIVRSIESASILGAKIIVVHPIHITSNQESEINMSYEEFNINYYKTLIPYCEKFGIKIATETMFYYDNKRHHRRGKLHHPETLSGIVKRIDSPWICACVDVGHVTITGSEPEDFIQKMDPEILGCLHVQDTDYITDSHTLPFVGKQDWEAIMASLKKIGYSGDLTYEICYFLDKFPPELIPGALKLSESVGRYLISLFDKA